MQPSWQEQFVTSIWNHVHRTHRKHGPNYTKPVIKCANQRRRQRYRLRMQRRYPSSPTAIHTQFGTAEVMAAKCSSCRQNMQTVSHKTANKAIGCLSLKKTAIARATSYLHQRAPSWTLLCSNRTKDTSLPKEVRLPHNTIANIANIPYQQIYWRADSLTVQCAHRQRPIAMTLPGLLNRQWTNKGGGTATKHNQGLNR